jgi:hypothetical protein
MEKKVYLGDGVYMALDDDKEYSPVVLTTEDGIRVSNTIYLDGIVLRHMIRVLAEWDLLSTGDI